MNDGRAPIRKADVLKQCTISLGESLRLLDARFTVTRDVCGFVMEFLAHVNKTDIALGFDIMEPQDGVQIQIIYAGDPNATFSVTGTCVGADEPKRTDSSL